MSAGLRALDCWCTVVLAVTGSNLMSGHSKAA